MTITLAIPLDPDHVEAVMHLRSRLGGPVASPPAIPHVSLLVVLEIPDTSVLLDAVRGVGARTLDFTVRARDIGVFLDGEESPVIHVPVVRSSELAHLHRAVFEVAVEAGATVEGQSHPDAWMPHVTIWGHALTPELVGRALTRYSAGPAVSWKMAATRLAWLDDAGVMYVERLGVSPCHLAPPALESSVTVSGH